MSADHDDAVLAVSLVDTHPVTLDCTGLWGSRTRLQVLTCGFRLRVRTR
jgi:hypothetical protein